MQLYLIRVAKEPLIKMVILDMCQMHETPMTPIGKQQQLFEHNYLLSWPSQSKFPLNEKSTGARVKDILIRDTHNTSQLLIVTGFTSLAHLIEIFGSSDIPNLEKVRVVFGFDIDQRVGKKPIHFSLSTEVKNYWAKQDVSLSLCSAVINLIEKVKSGSFEVRMIRHIHAKLYVGDNTAMLGSSNFSKTGIDSNQREANIRVTHSNEHEAEQYRNIKQIAENFFDLGVDYNKEFIELLEKLFKDANWEEALARAIAEILENKWMLNYPVLYRSIMGSNLWPTQQSGIAKAIKIIQDQGNCLLADPTGSGKTRLGTALLYTIFHWLWENGMKDRSNALIISPKQVVDSWKDSRMEFNLINEVVSMGQLSNGKEVNWKRIYKQLIKTDILLVDEAHNYLNWGTKRSSRIQPKKSAHVVLSTATPINKKADDLLRLIELLDIDNLSDDDLRDFIRLYPFKRKKPGEPELIHLQQYINQFIVRRTKKELNRIVQRSPDQYKNCNGVQCRYPDSVPKLYDVEASEEDNQAAGRINELVKELKGINYLQNLRIPDYLEKEEEKVKYVQRRFLSAPALAGFRVKSALRSSSVALYEVVYGTKAASKDSAYNLTTAKEISGNILETIEKNRQTLPEVSFPKEWIPSGSEWILDKDAYEAMCDTELAVYEKIGQEARKISNSRELSKVALLLQQAAISNKVLAFDATLITLDYLHKLLCERKASDIDIILATGQDDSGKAKVRDTFSHSCTHDGKKVIALCSDAMSEGINLPAAKTLVLLDIPSVPRIIEQRIGRIERMDSEHKEINVFWPEDNEPFSLKSDRRLIDTLITTERLIGGNVELPKEGNLSSYFAEQLDARGLIEGYKKFVEEEVEWQGVQDTTCLLQGLIDGEGALITSHIYDTYKDVDASVKTAISFIESERVWSFFALRGDVRRSAKWLLIEGGKGTTDFTIIARKLKEYLGGNDIVQRRWKDVELSKQFPSLLHYLRKHEALLLPPKKKRALVVGERLLKSYLDENDHFPNRPHLKEKVEHLLKWHQGGDDGEAVDRHHLADLWLQILQPELDKKRDRQKRKRKPICLYDLTNDDVNLSEEVLDYILDEGESASRIDEVIASCIISLKKL